MTTQWDTQSLYRELSQSALARERVKLELVGDAIVATMPEHGDLEIQLAVSGDQVFVSAPLCRASQVKDRDRFNDACLRLNPVNPLSNIGLVDVGDEDLYIVFGELSSRSSLDNVVEEIRVLADNTIEAAQAFAQDIQR